MGGIDFKPVIVIPHPHFPSEKYTYTALHSVTLFALQYVAFWLTNCVQMVRFWLANAVKWQQMAMCVRYTFVDIWT